jgi:hypothetical protein
MFLAGIQHTGCPIGSFGHDNIIKEHLIRHASAVSHKLSCKNIVHPERARNYMMASLPPLAKYMAGCRHGIKWWAAEGCTLKHNAIFLKQHNIECYARPYSTMKCPLVDINLFRAILFCSIISTSSAQITVV